MVAGTSLSEEAFYNLYLRLLGLARLLAKVLMEGRAYPACHFRSEKDRSGAHRKYPLDWPPRISGMARTLKVLFRRDPDKDRSREQIQYEGYQVLWPDGQPVTVGLDAFCRHGQRLLGLGRHLQGCTERLVDLMFFPLRDRDDDLVRIPGCRVRRFFLTRQGRQGRIHFLDGTPTAIVFQMDADEDRVLNWCGLPAIAEGADQWFDLAARPAEPSPVPAHGHRSNGRNDVLSRAALEAGSAV